MDPVKQKSSRKPKFPEIRKIGIWPKLNGIEIIKKC